MKQSMTAWAAIAFAAAMGTAQAADISQAAQTIDLSSGSNVFSRMIGAHNDGNTFSDRFDFSASTGASLSAFLYAFATPPASQGLAFSDFALYSNGGAAHAGTKVFEGPLSLWTNAAGNLQAANYYLLVSGKVLGDGAAQYNGGVTLTTAPVPEPATYGMLLGGLGALGLLARRRKSPPTV